MNRAAAPRPEPRSSTVMAGSRPKILTMVWRWSRPPGLENPSPQRSCTSFTRAGSQYSRGASSRSACSGSASASAAGAGFFGDSKISSPSHHARRRSRKDPASPPSRAWLSRLKRATIPHLRLSPDTSNHGPENLLIHRFCTVTVVKPRLRRRSRPLAGADPDSPFIPVIPARKGPGSRPPGAKSRGSHLPGGQSLV